MNNELIYKILIYIDNNLEDNISLDFLASSLFYNKDYLMRIFKRKFSVTIINYVNMLKIYKTLALYKSKSNNIAYIALSSNYNEPEYYTRIFKKLMGFTPFTYKKFINNYLSLDDDTYNKVLQKQIYLDTLMNTINNFKIIYTPRQAPKTLSIFKDLSK